MSSFLNDQAKRIPPGDGPRTFLAETGQSRPKVGALGKFVASDLPGFLHPVIDGQPDKTSYVPEDSVTASSTRAPAVLTREEALGKKKRPTAETMYPEAVQ